MKWSAPVNHAGRYEIQNDHQRVAVVDRLDDARLVAAAPDLLAALKMAQQVIDQHIPNEMTVCVPGVSKYIRDALVKAEGDR